MNLYQDIVEKKTKISIIGLGYVGLPIALAFARKASVIGFDINESRIELMKKHIDPSNELDKEEFNGCDILFTSNPDDLKNANFHIIAVPTPIDKNNLPDLAPLLSATKTVGAILKNKDYVVYESTVYPGATEEDCLPILEELSGLKCGIDFKLGYSPERINPGDKKHTIKTITKVVSGCDDESLEIIANVYKLVVDAGVHKASSIRVAEAAKIIENTQRDVNIGLMNELSMIFKKMNINTYDVLEAAATKWNFLKFYPGLVGGHCIGVDPYYLTYKASELGHAAMIINSGRAVNDNMSRFVVTELVKALIKANKNILQSRILIMGATFKEDVSDIRNSKVVEILNELSSYGIGFDIVDPNASAEEFLAEYDYRLNSEIKSNYDAVVLAVSHKEYKNFDSDYFNSILDENGILFDIKGIYRNQIQGLTYLSL